MIDGAEAAERFSLVEHPMSPRALAAPLHRHTREDEYSYVLEGAWARCWATTSSRPGPATWSTSRATSGTRSGTRATSRAGSSRSSRPPGSSSFFRELDDLGGAINADPEELAALNERYGLEMQPGVGSRACSSGSGCGSASSSPAAGRPRCAR